MTESLTDQSTGESAPPAQDQAVRTDLPVYECEYCGRAFAREEWRALHWGLEHPGALDDDQAEAFREAHADEEAELRRFRLKAMLTLVLIYFGLLMVYAVV